MAFCLFSRSFVRSFVGRERKERRHHRSSSRRPYIHATKQQIFDFSIPKRETKTKKKKRNEKHKNQITHVEYCQQPRVFFFFSFLVVVVSSGGIDARDDMYIYILLLLVVCTLFYISKGKGRGRNELLLRFSSFAFF